MVGVKRLAGTHVLPREIISAVRQQSRNEMLNLFRMDGTCVFCERALRGKESRMML